MALSMRRRSGPALPAGIAGALAAAAAIVAPGAAAGGDGRRSAETFQGTCEFSGILRQDPPLTNTPGPGRAVALAAGTCSGTLTGSKGKARQLDGARAGYAAGAEGTSSCAGGTAAGAGVLRIGNARIHFRFSEARGPGVGAIRLDGARGGSATGAARVSEDEDPVRIAEECGGSGLRQVRIEIDLATTPAISG
jgi:hypothetical protein